MAALLVGITGNMGSGKTLVSRMLNAYGIPVIDLDKIGHWALTLNEVKEQISLDFGYSVFRKNRTVDRKKLGKVVFDNLSKLENLNSIVHPVMLRKIREEITAYVRKFANLPYIVLDAALLFELGLDKELDLVITVSCPDSVRIERIRQRTKLNRAQIEKRFAFQIPQDEKKQRADYVIDNSSSIEKLQEKVNELHTFLLDVAARPSKMRRTSEKPGGKTDF
ncbi:dephospho-CoA kinase [candidate division KSB1 bacterium]|nr:dephospho-CoA kinase [candidate division KSB1 bacterium]